MRPQLSALAFAAVALASLASPALAQQRQAVDPVGATGPQDTEKVKQVFVYGEDPCPPSEGDEIVICARLPDNDRFRIPKELRSDPNAPQNQAWANRARNLETVGATGINSCSVAGAGGFTGCFAKLAREAKEERQTMMGSATWADAVQKAREERLANLDEESEDVEAQVQAEEANADARARAEAEARARLAAQEAAEKEKQGPNR